MTNDFTYTLLPWEVDKYIRGSKRVCLGSFYYRYDHNIDVLFVVVGYRVPSARTLNYRQYKLQKSMYEESLQFLLNCLNEGPVNG